MFIVKMLKWPTFYFEEALDSIVEKTRIAAFPNCHFDETKSHFPFVRKKKMPEKKNILWIWLNSSGGIEFSLRKQVGCAVQVPLSWWTIPMSFYERSENHQSSLLNNLGTYTAVNLGIRVQHKLQSDEILLFFLPWTLRSLNFHLQLFGS